MPIVGPTLRVLDRLALAPGRTPQPAPYLAAGARGEELAYLYLRTLGFTIGARDYCSPGRGDIDLTAWENETLGFVEVKTPSRRNFILAEAAVDDEKKAQVCSLAREDLWQVGHAQSTSSKFRLDVLSPYLESNGSVDITLLRNAFGMS